MKIVTFGQRTHEWLQWRKEGVTASEAAIIMDDSPYMTPWRLWAEKVGLAEPDDLSKNPFVQYGIEHEDVARQAFEELHPGEVALPLCAESSEESVLRASFDGVISRKRPVELKCPASKTFGDVIQYGTESAPYKLYWHQVQHQMYVSGADEGFLVFYHESRDLKVFRIVRDDLYLARLVKKAKEFRDRVLKGNPPEKIPERDILIPTGNCAEKWVEASETVKVYDAEIKSLQKKIDEHKAARKDAEDTLKGLLGEYHTGEYNGVRVNRYFREGKVNYNEFLRDKHPDADLSSLSQYKEQAKEVYRITVTDNALPKWSRDESAIDEVEEIKDTYEQSLFW
ncbi:YqaJ viral recombinase family protein [Marinobacter salicampi]|uniref:YqaJ viral recombinase family nuclease n=1 Tax=Marinobacter salicampi TaxID=435907 RepID=UPI00140C0CA0|nr:YqaJ viral recombinase family protein [Marinobacter salicampi]